MKEKCSVWIQSQDILELKVPDDKMRDLKKWKRLLESAIDAQK